MIVAHTKPNSMFSNALNQRGKPVMDSLAQELVHELLNWNSADYVWITNVIESLAAYKIQKMERGDS